MPPTDPDTPTLPVSVERDIDARCEAFETAWRRGGRPDVAAFADGAPAEGRASLLRELIRLDLFYRRQAGDPPAPGEYLERFPELAPGSAALAETLGGEAGPPTAETEVPRVEGYDLVGELGRGGMGVVYRARDLGLNRDVAVKVLPDRFAADSTAARRFLEEAQITGQLQHPAIPAVHAVGTTASGRPFLAMKLVKGRTLDVQLKERPNPAHDRGRFLAVFEQVCQAIGYAHSHGVIHRDIKPSNVMVGAFAEVQVMDWGLAKVLTVSREAQPSADADDEATAIHGARPDDDATQAGSLLGTPAYMPPEQAIGAIDQIDARSDVFGLGGVLCAILTGRPPFVGESPESTRQLAARAKLDDAFARLDGCGAEPELVALCKRCLAAEKADRPADAGAVAKAVNDFRAAAEDRAHRAEVERAEAAVRAAELRKRRSVQAALVGAVAALLALIAGGLWLRDRAALEREREDGERATASAARQAVADRDAAAALDLADGYLVQVAGIGHDPDRMALQLTSAGSALDRADAALRSGTPPGPLSERAAATRGNAARFRGHADFLAELERVRFEKAQLIGTPNLAAVVRGQYEAAFRRAGITPLGKGQGGGEGVVRDHPFRAFVRAGLFDWQHHCRGEDADRLGEFLGRTVGEADEFEVVWEEANQSKDVAAVRRVLARPATAALPAARLTNAVARLRRWAKPDFQREVWATVAAFHPNDFWVNYLFGDFLLDQTPLDIPEVTRRLATAAALRPRSAGAWSHLGWNQYYRLGQKDEGVRSLRWAADVSGPTNWRAPNNYGCALRDTGRTDEAVRAFERAADRDRTASYPLRNLGGIYHKGPRPDRDRALGYFRRAVPLEAGDGDSILGVVECLLALRRAAEAVTEADAAATAYQKSVEAWVALALAQEGADGNPARAVKSLERAAGLTPDRPEPAIRLTAELIRLDRPAALAQMYTTLNLARFRGSGPVAVARGDALAHLKKPSEAVTAYRRGRDLDPVSREAHVKLTVTLIGLRRFPEAEAAAGVAAARFPDDHQLHAEFGAAFAAREAWPQAVAAYERAIALNSTVPWYHRELGFALERKGDGTAAEAAYRETIARDPNARTTPRNLARMLAGQGRFVEALETLEWSLCAADWPEVELPHALAEAAGYAARAAAGEGRNPLPTPERAAVGRRGREVVESLLVVARRRFEADPVGYARKEYADLNRWYRNPDFKVTRVPAVLSLPPEEAAAWSALWVDYGVLLGKVRQVAAVK